MSAERPETAAAAFEVPSMVVEAREYDSIRFSAELSAISQRFVELVNAFPSTTTPYTIKGLMLGDRKPAIQFRRAFDSFTFEAALHQHVSKTEDHQCPEVDWQLTDAYPHDLSQAKLSQVAFTTATTAERDSIWEEFTEYIQSNGLHASKAGSTTIEMPIVHGMSRM